MEDREPDFTGWATRNDIRCADNRTIKAGAFAHMDKKSVPLVWMHQHNDVDNVLGHAILEDRAFGTYTKGYFNETPKAKNAKLALSHGDIVALSIFANGLTERKVKDGREVYHGDIKEVSLVLAGANPGAVIENVNILHSGGFDVLDDEAIIHTGLTLETGAGTDEEGSSNVTDDTTDTSESLEHADTQELDEETVKDIFDTFTEKQRNAVAFVIGTALDEGEDDDEDDEDDDSDNSATHGEDLTNTDEDESLAHSQEGGTAMGRNVFEQAKEAGTAVTRPTLSHGDQLSIIQDAIKRKGSLADSMQSALDDGVIKHDGVDGVDYGIADLDYMFPDHKNLDSSPQFIKRRTEWVNEVLTSVSKQPFAKIKSLLADITAEEARARGYVKGTMKRDEVIKLLKRTTGPTTVYKKQRLDRDDILDITDFDVVAWLKAEIRIMLDEEIARAILLGDGRSESNPDKIKDPEGAPSGDGIRSIVHDSEMYVHYIDLESDLEESELVDAITASRSFYKGSGNPTLFTTDQSMTRMLLERDKVGRRLYGTETELASVLRVGKITPVEVMEEYGDIFGIIVNLRDYTVGANKGGEVTFFDDFDIDFNQEKYLMETRISGALNRPKAAIVLRQNRGEAVTPTAPSFADNTITIPTVTGVIYQIDGEPRNGDVEIEADTEVTAIADEGYHIPAGQTRRWTYTFTA